MGHKAAQNIPEAGLLPAGLLLFEIAEGKETETSTNKLAYQVQLVVLEPAGARGMPAWNMFTIGSNDDPMAEEDETWRRSFGGRQMKTMAVKAGVAFDGRDMDEVCADLKGQRVLAMCEVQVEPETGKDGLPNAYAGRIRNNFTAWYAPGSREPFLKEEGQTGAPLAKPAPRPATAAQQKGNGAAKPVEAKKPAGAATFTCTACVPQQVIARAQLQAHMEQKHPEE